MSSGQRNGSPRRVQITIAHTESCGHAPGARALIERVAPELALEVEVTMALVTSAEAAGRPPSVGGLDWR